MVYWYTCTGPWIAMFFSGFQPFALNLVVAHFTGNKGKHTIASTDVGARLSQCISSIYYEGLQFINFFNVSY